MKNHPGSHLDHELTPSQVAYLFERFAERSAFFIETLELPVELGMVPCYLYGPAMGDPPVLGTYTIPPSTTEHKVRSHPRGARTWSTRSIERDARPTRIVTVIAGPHNETCGLCNGTGIGPYGTEGGWPVPGGTACKSCEHGTIKHACILYTAFGGPCAPQEPGDPSCKDIAASTAFWAEHALGCSPLNKPRH